jgi:hypothetical protein
MILLARKVLAHEAQGRRSPGEIADAFEAAYLPLRRRLEPVLGAGGVNILFARALNLSSSEFPFLQRVEAEELTGGLKRLRESTQGYEASEVSEGFVVLLATLIWLLSSFIGEDLALRMTDEAWSAALRENEGIRG